jgi:hypothetical protein
MTIKKEKMLEDLMVPLNIYKKKHKMKIVSVIHGMIKY